MGYRQIFMGFIALTIFIFSPAAYGENIDPDNNGSQYTWGENVGWINFEPLQGGITVTDTAVSGYAWGENIGWINLSPTMGGGVVNDGNGNLSGYAWAENVGWINFAPTGGGVSINPNTGVFSGYAWGENIGWINFSPATGGGVKTSWRADFDNDGYTADVDCNDSDGTVNPGAIEGPYGNATCSDGKDNNCNNLIDSADPNCQSTNADLIVSSWTAPANACAGAAISIKDTTKNQGTGLAGASTTKFYFSTNTTLDAGDTPLGSRAVPSLNPAAISTGTTSVTLPNVAIGKYYLIAMADDGKVVPETNETNNKKSKAIYIGPDLIVSTLTAPTSAIRGTTISIGDTTKNKGCGIAGASTTKFYLSTNTTINIGVDYELGTRPVPALGTNAVSTGATSVVIPAGIPTGKYYIIANSDDSKVVVEGNETNNKKTKVITIQ